MILVELGTVSRKKEKGKKLSSSAMLRTIKSVIRFRETKKKKKPVGVKNHRDAIS